MDENNDSFTNISFSFKYYCMYMYYIVVKRLIYMQYSAFVNACNYISAFVVMTSGKAL